MFQFSISFEENFQNESKDDKCKNGFEKILKSNEFSYKKAINIQF